MTAQSQTVIKIEDPPVVCFIGKVACEFQKELFETLPMETCFTARSSNSMISL